MTEDSPQMTLLVLDAGFERLTAALMVATAAAAAGVSVSIYFAFWGLLLLRRRRTYAGKSLLARLMTLFLPSGPASLATMRLHCAGAGRWFFERLMRQHGMATPEQLLDTARDLGVRLVVCPLSMEMMGITQDELLPGLEFGGVATLVGQAAEAHTNLVF